MKNARTGGSFRWHQDYGYWYRYHTICPDMLTIFTAMDRSDIDNGCLRVMRGSHRLGRIDHDRVPDGDQIGVDPERLAILDKRFETLPVILNPGDSLIFHCNLLHSSSRNDSDRRRWAIISCYSSVENDEPNEAHPPNIPLTILDNDAVIKTGVSRDLIGKDIVFRDENGGKFFNRPQ